MTKYIDNQLEEVREHMKISMNKLEPKKGDVVIVRVPVDTSPEHKALLAEQFNHLDLADGVNVMIMTEESEVSLLKESQMAQMGWIRDKNKMN